MQTFTGDSQYARVCGGSLLTRSGLAQSLRRPICTRERRSGEEQLWWVVKLDLDSRQARGPSGVITFLIN